MHSGLFFLTQKMLPLNTRKKLKHKNYLLTMHANYPVSLVNLFNTATKILQKITRSCFKVIKLRQAAV